MNQQEKVASKATMQGGAVSAEEGRALFQKAIGLHRQNLVAQAQALYREVLRIYPKHVDAIHMLGVACRQLGALPEALALLNRAVTLAPGRADTLSNRGNVLLDLGQVQAALDSYNQAVALKPDFVDGYCNRANVLESMGRFDEALADFQKALALAPKHHDAQVGVANSLQNLKRHSEAMSAYRKALQLVPDRPATLSNMAGALLDLGRFEEAEEVLSAIITSNPEFAQAYINRANLFLATQKHEAALLDVERALLLSPAIPDAWLTRGNVLQELKRFPEAIESYDRGLALRPSYLHCINNKGNALRELGRHSAALQQYDMAVELQPDYAEAHFHRGLLLQDLKRFQESEAAFATAVQLKEDHPLLFGQWIASRMMMCAWDGLPIQKARLAAKIQEGKNASPTFSTLSAGVAPELVKQCARAYINDKVRDRSASFTASPPHANRRIKIGYFSSDFRSHPVSQLAVGVFESHDHERFEVLGFNISSLPADSMTERVERAFGGLVQLGSLSVSQIVAKVRALELDIAIDLNGHTRGANLPVFAHRVAPIQVNYLGYPGTSGAPFFDYILGDPTVIPPEHLPHYTEKVAHLPHCYLPNDAKKLIAPRGFSRVEEGLPEQGFVFCCFNNSYKINPDIFALWMRLLKAVPGSVLWLSELNSVAMGNLRSHAASCGVAPDRIVFASRTHDLADHLARHQLADLFLDTTDYNAHTTASDALWAGLPVLTCLGDAFPGRVAASLLRAVGLPEMVTLCLEDYETLALRLVREPGLLADVKARLLANRVTHPLFRTEQFTRDLESTYVRMWERHRRGQSPDHLLNVSRA